MTQQPFYAKDLESIREKILLMSQESIKSVCLAISSLQHMSREEAEKVIKLDDKIDKLEVTIDAECVRYLSLRAPVVMDVRLITFAMRASQDLERVADESCSVARRVCSLIKHKEDDKARVSLLEMGRAVVSQLQSSIDSFIQSDIEKSYAVIKEDLDIDRHHRRHFKIFTREDNETIQSAIDLLFISKSLERIGDHACNLAEEVIYLIEADDVRFKS